MLLMEEEGVTEKPEPELPLQVVTVWLLTPGLGFTVTVAVAGVPAQPTPL